MSFIQNMDSRFVEFIQYFHSSIVDKFFFLITSLGDYGFIWLVISSILIINRKTRRTGLLSLVALILATQLGELIKHIIQRPRPFVEYSNLKTILPNTTGYSFPSGHTISSFAVAGVLMKELKKYKIAFLILASGIAFSRIYFYLHYPTDIIAGILLGLICSWVVLKISRRYRL